MRKKSQITTGIAIVMALMLNYLSVRADDEGGGGHTTCVGTTNICYQIVKKGKVIASYPGILNVTP